jgi:hypothetical protein
MLIETPPHFIETLLTSGGMPQEMVEHAHIEGVNEGNLAVTYKIDTEGKVYYLKIGEAEGARGGCFIKHLIPIQDAAANLHAEKRRKKMRKMLENVIKTHRATIAPRPLFFDGSDAMGNQRQKKEQGIFAEYRIPKKLEEIETPPKLVGMAATLWEGLEISHLETSSPDKTDVYDPISYTPETVFKTMAACAELQRYGQNYLEREIQRKVAAGKGNEEVVRAKLYAKLQHEQRSLLGFDFLVGHLLKTLSLPEDLEEAIQALDDPTQLQQRSQEILQSVAAENNEALKQSLMERVAPFNRFLSKKRLEEMTFQELVFAAEREKAWPPEELLAAKRCIQCDLAREIMTLWTEKPHLLKNLLVFLKNFEPIYREAAQLAQGIVTQDSHPFNLFIHDVDHEISILDLEDLSVSSRITDLATINLFKIMRAVANEEISLEEAQALVQATFEGFNSQASSPLTDREKKIMADYTLAVFLNHLMQFSYILNLNPKDLGKLNLAMALDRFSSQLETLQKSSILWNELRLLYRTQ